MKIFEGKSPSERNKLIAALALGGMAVLSLVYTFGGMFSSGKKTAITVSVSPKPTATVVTGNQTNVTSSLLTEDQISSEWLTTPVDYRPGSFYSPDAGRNIFAFYEPPAPTPYV